MLLGPLSAVVPWGATGRRVIGSGTGGWRTSDAEARAVVAGTGIDLDAVEVGDYRDLPYGGRLYRIVHQPARVYHVQDLTAARAAGRREPQAAAKLAAERKRLVAQRVTFWGALRESLSETGAGALRLALIVLAAVLVVKEMRR